MLILVSTVCFALSLYLGFANYWILTHWTKTEAAVLSGELRQYSSGPTGPPQTLGKPSYFFHCTVSYLVGGKNLQSQLDSPSSPYRIDAQVWGGQLSPGRSIDIRYKELDPSRIRLANHPAEITVGGPIKAGFFFLVPGLLLRSTAWDCLTTKMKAEAPPPRNRFLPI